MENILDNVDYKYNEMIRTILEKGNAKGDRTGTGTTSLFGYQMRFDLSKGFPILSGKKVAWRLITSELLWFLHGDTNIKYLLENKNTIWNEWAFKNWVESDEYEEEFPNEDMTDFGLRSQSNEEFKKLYDTRMKEFENRILTNDKFAEKFGTLGDVYGKQWRSWEGANGKTLDQIVNVIEQIKTNPNSRRLIVSAWNPTEVDNMALPPCHCFFQFYVNNNKLSCQLYQR